MQRSLPIKHKRKIQNFANLKLKFLKINEIFQNLTFLHIKNMYKEDTDLSCYLESWIILSFLNDLGLFKYPPNHGGEKPHRTIKLIILSSLNYINLN